MKVRFVDVDSKIPNRAGMLISAWHKARGDDVSLYKCRGRSRQIDLASWNFDKTYISCVFSKNANFAKNLARIIPNSVLGGYDVNEIILPDEIEHIMPDYDLYGCKFSLGATSWGCIRKCPWCDISRIQGELRDHAPIQEFHHPNHSKIMLLDNNIIPSPRWRENWNYILEQGLKVCVTQGFDARLVTEEIAGMIADAKCYDTKFKNRAVYTAWDNPADETEVLRGIQRLLDAGVHGPNVIVYELVKFNTTLEQDLYRFKRLIEMGVRPFVMLYNGNRDHPMVRWGQRPAIYMRIPFEEYRKLKEMGISHPEEEFRKDTPLTNITTSSSRGDQSRRNDDDMRGQMRGFSFSPCEMSPPSDVASGSVLCMSQKKEEVA